MSTASRRRVYVSARRFAEEFARRFGRRPTQVEFVMWCTAWGGTVRGDRCVFDYATV